MFEQVNSPTLIDITLIHMALYLLIPVLLGKNRLKALISASFAFSIINLSQLSVINCILFLVATFINSSSYVGFLRNNPNIYYCGIFFNNVVIAVCCFFAARWLRETKLKLPLMLYVIFNLLFILFPLVIFALYGNIVNVLPITFYLLSSFLLSSIVTSSILISSIASTLFLLIMLFLFYLYTRLSKDDLTTDLNVTESPLSLNAEKGDKYAQFIELLSRRELEVIEAILAGNVRHKQISAKLNISVSTVKTHLIHIYQTTGVSSIAALSLLFHGYAPQTPKNQP